MARIPRFYDVDKFVKLKKTDNTRGLYRTALMDFAQHLFAEEIAGIPNRAERVDRAIALLNAHVKDQDIDPVSEIADYITSRARKTESTTGTYTSIIRGFYEMNNHVWNKAEMRAIKPKTVIAVTKDEPISLAVLKRMVDATDLHGKLLITLLVSTGCRIGEIVRVEIKDISLDEEPARIHLPGAITKTKEARTVFLTDEARDLIRHWIGGGRAQYLKNAEHKGKCLTGGGPRPAPENDKRLIGCTDDTARVIFRNALRNALVELKQDELTRRHLINPHSIRKYFRTVSVQTMPLDVVEAIMGHKGYLTSSYVRLTEDQLAGAFKKGSYVLSISDGIETRGIREKVESQADRQLALERENVKLKAEQDERFATMEADMRKMQEKIALMKVTDTNE